MTKEQDELLRGEVLEGLKDYHPSGYEALRALLREREELQEELTTANRQLFAFASESGRPDRWRLKLAEYRNRAEAAKSRLSSVCRAGDAQKTAVQLAIDAISTCEEDAFGTGSDGLSEWPIKAEILSKLTESLAAWDEATKGVSRG